MRKKGRNEGWEKEKTRGRKGGEEGGRKGGKEEQFVKFLKENNTETR